MIPKGKIWFMFNYAVCQIKGKQYKITPDQPFLVDWFGEEKEPIESEVLLISKGDEVEVGTPFLKEKIKLDNLGLVLGTKIRAAKFHAKAKYRKVTGLRPRYTKLVYSVKKA